jgi:hypothetical protein
MLISALRSSECSAILHNLAECVNMWNMARLGFAGRGRAPGRETGIDRARAVEVLANSASASPMVKHRGPFVVEQSDEPWFDLEHPYAGQGGACPGRPGGGKGSQPSRLGRT